MRIPSNAVVAPKKLSEYLLVPRRVDDKSRFLRKAGFDQSNPEALESSIRVLASMHSAFRDRISEYGRFWRVDGDLAGPTGRLRVTVIWLERASDGEFHFITLKPLR